MREMGRLLGEEGGGGGGKFIPDPRTEKRQVSQLTTTCGDKKGVVPRFETVKSAIVSGSRGLFKGYHLRHTGRATPMPNQK